MIVRREGQHYALFVGRRKTITFESYKRDEKLHSEEYHPIPCRPCSSIIAAALFLANERTTVQ